MVTVTGYSEKRNKKGSKFYTLNIQGGLEMTKSEETGTVFAQSFKTSIVASGMTEELVKSLVGQSLPGDIRKTPCEPYTITTRTGHNKVLDFTYEYFPEERENPPHPISEDSL